MSWPSDGGPRYKVASIRGGMIGRSDNAWGLDVYAPMDFYVLDRASCHRIVRRISVHPARGGPAAGRSAIEHICARLNGESDPL
jgi:hypothetical protein